MYDEEDKLMCDLCGKSAEIMWELVINPLRDVGGEYVSDMDTLMYGFDVYMCPQCFMRFKQFMKIHGWRQGDDKQDS